MSDERWLPVPGYEGSYEISDRGRLRGLRGLRSGSGSRLIKPEVNAARGGYYQVRLYVGRKAKRANIHRLVLEAFVGPKPAGLVTRHLNGNPVDNRLENLQYGTQVENIADQVVHGTAAYLTATKCINGHPYSDENRSNDSRLRCRVCERARYARYYQAKKSRDAA